MKFANIYTTEFLSELNLVLTQEDFGNKLYDLLNPIKNLLQQETDLMTYSLARHCGANARLAFTCEWYLLASRMVLNNRPLIEENKKHFIRKIDPKYKELRNLDKLVQDDILNTFLPLQISFLNLKAKEFIDEQLIKFPFLAKYLNSHFLSQFTSSELQLRKGLYIDSPSLNNCIEIQGSRLSFVYLCLPCLVGLSYSFNQDDSIINPKGVKWSQLDDVFKQIASLHQMKDDTAFVKVVYEASLDLDQKLSWLVMEEELKSKISFENDAAIEVIAMLRDRIYEKLTQDLEKLIIPEKQKEIITELAKWAYQVDSSQSQYFQTDMNK